MGGAAGAAAGRSAREGGGKDAGIGVVAGSDGAVEGVRTGRGGSCGGTAAVAGAARAVATSEEVFSGVAEKGFKILTPAGFLSAGFSTGSCPSSGGEAGVAAEEESFARDGERQAAWGGASGFGRRMSRRSEPLPGPPRLPIATRRTLNTRWPGGKGCDAGSAGISVPRISGDVTCFPHSGHGPSFPHASTGTVSGCWQCRH